jgi:hypothetical protein
MANSCCATLEKRHQSDGCHTRWIDGCFRSFPGVDLGSGAKDDYGFFQNVVFLSDDSIFTP